MPQSPSPPSLSNSSSSHSLHKPVLLEEVLQFARETPRPLRRGLDVTFGRGGHTRALLEAHPDLQMTALDRDRDALAYAESAFAPEIASGRLKPVHGNFHEKIPAGEWDFILADLGVSSPQLDVAERGFSFYHDGPLDMRMDQSQGITAADIVNTWPPDDLIALFRELGEIRRPNLTVQKIIEFRRAGPFSRTHELSRLIERAEGWRRKGHHPATNYFLALRLEVNQELGDLRPAAERLIHQLAAGGRLAMITFHSLEDRIIKYAFKESAEGFPVTKKVVAPGRPECAANPRARSAKLRVFQRGEPP
jgi:16S rRNA (cytosine1402-N4)-methyltransferase